MCGGLLYSLLLGWGYGRARQNVVNERRKHELERELIESELMLLKAQFNPHFLYNVLSFMYGKSGRYIK